jgi:hypothetical protein
VTVHAKSRFGPKRPQPVNGLQSVAPCLLEEVIALEDECNGDALTRAEHAEGRFVCDDHFHLGADLFCGRSDGVEQLVHGTGYFSGCRISFDEILASEAGAFNDDDLRVMQETIEKCRSERGVIVENLS